MTKDQDPSYLGGLREVSQSQGQARSAAGVSYGYSDVLVQCCLWWDDENILYLCWQYGGPQPRAAVGHLKCGYETEKLNL